MVHVWYKYLIYLVIRCVSGFNLPSKIVESTANLWLQQQLSLTKAEIVASCLHHHGQT